jgi:hypothetical protein
MKQLSTYSVTKAVRRITGRAGPSKGWSMLSVAGRSTLPNPPSIKRLELLVYPVPAGICVLYRGQYLTRKATADEQYQIALNFLQTARETSRSEASSECQLPDIYRGDGF